MTRLDGRRNRLYAGGMLDATAPREPDTIAVVCGRRIAQARRERGLTQRQLATKCGIAQGHVSHFECGVREPLVRNLIRLADALDVTTDFLLGRDRTPAT